MSDDTSRRPSRPSEPEFTVEQDAQLRVILADLGYVSDHWHAGVSWCEKCLRRLASHLLDTTGKGSSLPGGSAS